MSNGIATLPAALLAALIVALGGCDTHNPPAPQSAIEAPESRLSDVRYRIDPVRNRVWSLSHEGVFLHDLKTREGD